jgi:hypothetical protein
MAWITKPSATTEIERRDEPYLTEAMQAVIRDEYQPRFETTMACILPALHLIQHEYGWVPKQAMDEIASCSRSRRPTCTTPRRSTRSTGSSPRASA